MVALGLMVVGSVAQHGWVPGEYHHAYKPLMRSTGHKFLKRWDVRQELGITEQQWYRIEQIHERKKYEERLLKASALPWEQYERRKRELERQYDIRQALTSQQRARLFQLELQWNGAISLVNPEIARQVGLSEQQQAQIREIALRAASEAHASHRGARKHEKKLIENQLRERVNQQILSVLTAQQRERWQRMLGARFVFVD